MSERRGLRSLVVAAGLLVTVGCMYLAVRGVELEDALDALADSDLRWLLPALPVFALAVVLRAVRWWSVFADDARPPMRAIAYALLIGYFFNNILPARAGEAARVIALHRRAATPRAETVGTVVVERLFDVLGLLIVLFASYPWLPEVSWLRAAAIFGAVVVTAVVALVVVVVRYDERALHWLLSPLRRIRRAGFAARVQVAAVNATRGLVGLRRPRVALRAMALTIASWVTLGFSFWILTRAFALELPLVAGMLVTVAVNLSLVLPSSPAALGVFEAATVIALLAFDVPQAQALSYALVLHLLNLVPFLVIGAALLGPGALRARP
ncbi:MAG TPA: lysylphosphatidylglycerol synthase transmembrane domain-containing protein [Solirubrobacteraceae bacterium]|nr:lysylphosphatidylglycerol synthase transmembrane domain-containing protein [Solirubrobacteraceae bacterium]